ncbi:MAG: hypothetical protein COT71_03010 [Candidatus Andersenbacteria bacterium CG10_big_fil_rev_8_21_14_0_10_54_11]|uniref:Uncharacterized protein n=1 Tax=Candidatus Andersenbacteria bacterium CG10_big_fil_rev_8_21_14_0_10_54_11 TaxID=1974485 RepID=A0A2M6WZ01_9BACT|nr:MAG: hypothetical protein COT71_03010 [Candidatus Andersenbacteria bacterium CG10_big_fil_rev_8_21_14_0_10_54_11]
MQDGQIGERSWHRLFVLVLLGIIIAGIYSVALHGPFIFDDAYAIVESKQHHHLPHSFREMLYSRSVSFLTLEATYAAVGLNTMWYHAGNILIHVCAVFAVFWLVYLLGRGVVPLQPLSVGRWHLQPVFAAALLGAAFFGFHPVQTQSVSYIVQRLSSLAALFYTVSLAAYVSYRRANTWHNRVVWTALSLGAGLLAVHSKETAVTLPAGLWLLEVIFFTRRWRPLLRRTVRLWPWVLLATIIPAYTLGITEYLDRDAAAAAGAQPHLTVQRALLLTQERQTLPFDRLDYLLTEINVVRTYIRLVAAPFGLHLDWDYPITYSLWAGWTVPSLVFEAALIGAAIWGVRRGWRLAGFGALFFFLALLPESSFIPIYDVLFEHRLYLPMVGAASVFAEFAIRMWQFAGRRFGSYGAASLWAVTLCVWLVILAAATVQRNTVWRTSLAVWVDSAAKSPNKPRPHNNTGLEYFAAGGYQEALAEFRQAAALNPDYAEAENNIGMVSIQLGKFDEAEQHLIRALSLKPDYAHALNNLGAVYLQRGQLDQAKEAFERAIQYDSDYAAALDNLGLVLIRLEQLTEATNILQNNIQLNPAFVSSYNNLGVALSRLGRSQEALELFQRALAIEPENMLAQHNLLIMRGAQPGSGLRVLP